LGALFSLRCRADESGMVNSISGSSGAGSVSDSSAQDKMRQMREDVLTAVASQLGESEADLKKAMSSGQSLAQIAQAKGVSSQDLQTTIAGVVQKDMPNASADQVSNIANRISGAGGHHHHHGGHHAQATTQPVAAPSPADDSTVSVVA
jgi:hypothetical protein